MKTTVMILSFRIVIAWQTVQTQMILVTRKPVFGISDQLRLKPECPASEAS